MTETASIGSMPVCFSHPESPRAAIVVVQEAFGLTPHVCSIADRLAAAGYAAAAPALFHRQGSPVFGYDEYKRAVPVLDQLHSDEIDSDIGATMAFLRERTSAEMPLAILGFCMGGTVAFHAGTSMAVDAVVSFYGGAIAKARFGYPSQVKAAPRLHAPFLGLYGDLDPLIPVDDVEALRNALESVEVDSEIVRYSQAGHGFNCDQRGSYEPMAAADAWRRTLDWFDRHLG